MPILRVIPVLLLALVACSTVYLRPATAIVGVTLLDGSGKAPTPDTTVVIRGDRIVSVGASPPRGAVVIQGAGLTLTPGFVDMHNHSGGGLERDPTAATQVSQGITTMVLGQDGGSEFPVGPYLDGLDVSVNVLTFVGQSTLREKRKDDGPRAHASGTYEGNRSAAEDCGAPKVAR